jgi:hypothetical protein
VHLRNARSAANSAARPRVAGGDGHELVTQCLR